MQTQRDRDEKTVVITTAVGLFCLVMAIGALGLWAAVSWLDLGDSGTNAFLALLVAAAAGVLLRYLVRARRH